MTVKASQRTYAQSQHVEKTIKLVPSVYGFCKKAKEYNANSARSIIHYMAEARKYALKSDTYAPHDNYEEAKSRLYCILELITYLNLIETEVQYLEHENMIPSFSSTRTKKSRYETMGQELNDVLKYAYAASKTQRAYMKDLSPFSKVKSKASVDNSKKKYRKGNKSGEHTSKQATDSIRDNLLTSGTSKQLESGSPSNQTTDDILEGLHKLKADIESNSMSDSKMNTGTATIEDTQIMMMVIMSRLQQSIDNLARNVEDNKWRIR